MKITDQLIALAGEWSAAQRRSTARLATIVVNDGSFFERIGKPGAGCNTNTVEKFLSFFRDGSNWPEGRIPAAAVDLLDNFANIATDDAAASHGEADSGANEAPSAGKVNAPSPSARMGAAV